MSKIEDFKEYEHSTSFFRIIACTYQGLLYGIDVILFLKEDAKISCIHSIAVGGRYLVCGGVDEVIKLYDLRKKKDLGSLHYHSGTITGLVFSSKISPKFLISVSEDGTMAIFRTKDWSHLTTIKTHHGRVNSISIHPSGKAAFTVGSDRNIRLWNMMTGKKAGKFNLNKNEAFCIQWNTTGDHYAVLLNKGVMIYDMSATLVYCFSSPIQLNSIHYAVSKKKQHEMLILGFQDGHIQIRDSSNGKLLESFVAHENRIKAITSCICQPVNASSSFLILITASSNGSIKLWVELEEFFFFQIGEYNCGESRITCMSIADSFVENLEKKVETVD